MWNNMSEYVRSSYRNILHNYNVMRSLDAEEENATASKTKLLELKQKPRDEDLAVPGCSSWLPDIEEEEKTLAATNKIPEIKHQPSDNDLAVPGCSSQLLDAEDENATASKPKILELKQQPTDEDLAVPGCSSWLPGQITSLSDNSAESSEDDEFGFVQKDKDVFTCGQCGINYTSPKYLEAHSKHCRGRRVAVKEPSQVPTDIERLARVVHGRKIYCCNVCSYKSTKTTNFKNHIIAHSGAKHHVCKECGKCFTKVLHRTRTHGCEALQV